MKCRSGTPKRGGFYEPLRARLQFYNPRVLISRMNEEEVVRRDEIEKARFLVRSRIRSYKLFLEIDDSKRLWKIRLRRRSKPFHPEPTFRTCSDCTRTWVMGRDRVFTLLCSLHLGLCDVLNCYLWRPFSRNVMTSALTSLVRFGVLTSISSFRLAGTPFLDLCVRSHVPRIQMSAKILWLRTKKD